MPARLRGRHHLRLHHPKFAWWIVYSVPNGVTEVLNPRNPSSPTKRLTLAAESLDTFEATVSGQPPAPANPLTLVPSRPRAGSAFHVVAPA